MYNSLMSNEAIYNGANTAKAITVNVSHHHEIKIGNRFNKIQLLGSMKSDKTSSAF
jgi:hypothetical protein